MGIIIRQSFKSSTAMYFGAAVGVFNRLYLLPKFLTPEQIGLVDLLLIVSLFIASISSLGVIGSLVKFYNVQKEKGNLANFIGYILSTGFIGYLVAVAAIVIFKEEIVSYYSKDSALLNEFYYLIIPLTLVFILKGFFSNYSVTNQRATVPSLLSDFMPKIAMAGLIVFLSYEFLPFSGLVYWLVASYLFFNVLLIVYCIKQFKLRLAFNFSSISKIDKGKIAKYNFFVLLSGMSGYVAQFTDTAMVGSMKGLEWAGIYSIAFFLGSSIEMPKRAISSISLPIIVKHFDTNEYASIDKLYKQSSINQGIVGGLLLLLIFVNLDGMFELIPNSEKYVIGKYVAIIIAFGRWVEMITGVNSEILRSSRYYFWDLITVTSFIVLSVVSNYYLIPLYGLNGAAIASLISILFYNMVRIIVLKALYGFFPFTIKTTILILTMSALAFVHVLLPNWEFESLYLTLLVIGVKTLIYGSIFVFICFKLKLSEEVNSIVKMLLSKVNS